MSPMTALFLGLCGVTAVGIASGTGIVLYGLRIANLNASSLLNLADSTIAGLPELIERLPPALADLLDDRRAPDYAENLDVKVTFLADTRSDRIRPVMTVTNNGSSVVTMLTIRVAALNQEDVPLQEWTELVATPIGLNDDLRGPIFPGSTRHIVLRRGYLRKAVGSTFTGAVEISELRIGVGAEES
ncbi:MAG: hypothetical protein IID42_12455 [Planctomycetes bacterium]|nr:hypothetical protein [Planctomycetota bacterium]